MGHFGCFSAKDKRTFKVHKHIRSQELPQQYEAHVSQRDPLLTFYFLCSQNHSEARTDDLTLPSALLISLNL